MGNYSLAIHACQLLVAPEIATDAGLKNLPSLFHQMLFPLQFATVFPVKVFPVAIQYAVVLLDELIIDVLVWYLISQIIEGFEWSGTIFLPRKFGLNFYQE